MTISSLRITDFRNLSNVELLPLTTGLNIITGANGSGKTSLLEAIHYLGHGRSFRTSTLSPLVNHSADKFSIFSRILTQSDREINIGAERGMTGSSRFKIADKETSGISELANIIPIRVIDSNSHQLFESGPLFRRKYLDWGLFYQFDNFYPTWRSFERALKQRNLALRDRHSRNELDAWTSEFIKYGIEFDSLRKQYIKKLEPYLLEMTKDLLPFESVALSYSPGWDESMDLDAVLAHALAEEYRIGHSQYGPHRADLDVSIDGVLARQILSRGQQKLLICAMILAQGRMLASCVNKNLIYLIDDLPSELDANSREKLLALLVNQQTQVFITTIERESISESINKDLEIPLKVFHVEHGKVVVQ